MSEKEIILGLTKGGIYLIEYLLARGINLARIASLREQRIAEGGEGLTDADRDQLAQELTDSIEAIPGTGV